MLYRFPPQGLGPLDEESPKAFRLCVCAFCLCAACACVHARDGWTVKPLFCELRQLTFLYRRSKMCVHTLSVASVRFFISFFIFSCVVQVLKCARQRAPWLCFANRIYVKKKCIYGDVFFSAVLWLICAPIGRHNTLS